MRAKLFLLIPFLFVFLTALGQHHAPHEKINGTKKISKRFMDPKGYKQLYKKEPDYSNPENFMVIRGDTMIAVDDSKFSLHHRHKHQLGDTIARLNSKAVVAAVPH